MKRPAPGCGLWNRKRAAAAVARIDRLNLASSSAIRAMRRRRSCWINSGSGVDARMANPPNKKIHKRAAVNGVDAIRRHL